jgi:hypothetical protein
MRTSSGCRSGGARLGWPAAELGAALGMAVMALTATGAPRSATSSAGFQSVTTSSTTSPENASRNAARIWKWIPTSCTPYNAPRHGAAERRHQRHALLAGTTGVTGPKIAGRLQRVGLRLLTDILAERLQSIDSVSPGARRIQLLPILHRPSTTRATSRRWGHVAPRPLDAGRLITRHQATCGLDFDQKRSLRGSFVVTGFDRGVDRIMISL